LIAGLSVSSQFLGEKQEIEANQVNTICKRSLIGPIQMIQGKTRGPKRSTKTQRSGSGRTEQTSATTGYLWCLPRPVFGVARSCCLARTAVRSPLLPICVFPLHLFGFLRGFLVFKLLISSFKRMYLAAY